MNKLLFLLNAIIYILNFGEQIGVYYAQKSLQLDHQDKRKIFYILIGINSVSIFKMLIPNKSIKVVLLILIELAELFSYLFILPQRTKATLIVGISFSVIEIILHIIYSTLLMKSNHSHLTDSFSINRNGDRKKNECGWRKCRKLFAHLIIFMVFIVNPVLILFVDPTSRFRQTFSEIFLIIILFVASQTYHFTIDDDLQRNAHQDILDLIYNFTGAKFMEIYQKLFKISVAEMCPIQMWWTIINIHVSILINLLLMPIIFIVFASLQLRNDELYLPTYDRKLYIYLIIFNSPILALCCLIYCQLIYRIFKSILVLILYITFCRTLDTFCRDLETLWCHSCRENETWV